jgi:hypothetical protein
MVVGSNDENTWEYIDLQNIKKSINTFNRKPVVFNINSTKSFSYYRLIIMEMPPNNNDIKINQWSLNFVPYLSKNIETLTNMNVENYASETNNYYFSKYNTSTPLKIENIDNSIVNDENYNNNYNDILPIIYTSILAISLLYYYNKKY